MTDGPPPEVWVVIADEDQPRAAYDDRGDANEVVAVEKEKRPDSEWRAERYQLASLVQRNNLPLSQRWLDIETVATMLGMAPRTVRERIARRPDFPKPARVGAVRTVGSLRWNAGELDAWIRRQQQANT
jgi:predicted DNA-binding transcriptional regulator AlpA